MTNGYDVIVIGGGHNGLVAAGYLARAGRRVVVLERRPILGGATATEEIHPGFRVPTGAALCGLLRPEIVRDLNLARHGFQQLPLDPTITAVGEDGKVLRLWRDVAKSQQEIAKHSKGDAEAFARFHAFMVNLATVADPLMVRTPPKVTSMSRGEQLYLLRRANRLRKMGRDVMSRALRMPMMSLRGFLNEWFETDLLRATLAADALIGRWGGPWSPGTAFGLLHQYLPQVHGGSWGLIRGGTGSLADALAASAKAAGATIRTEAPVARIVLENGRAMGVELSSGEKISARVVVSSADAKQTFLKMIDTTEMERDFLHKVRGMRTEGALAKVNLALKTLPSTKGEDGGPAARIRYAPSLEFLERAYDDAKYGRASAQPFVDITIPTVVDPSLAPSGNHVMSVLVQYAPYHLRQGSWPTEREKLTDRVLDRLENLMPGVRNAILAQEVLTPVELEERFALTGGHMYHGEMTLEQQLFLRPVPGWSQYRTPIQGLYLCGASTHPGGGISGAPAYNAAREILKDWNRARAA